MVLVAAKQLALAKTRLSPVLPSTTERSMLAEAMFRDVLAAALSAHAADGVAVISSDATLLGLAHNAGAFVIDELCARGLNAAVRMGTEILLARGASTVCTVLSDIPMVAGEDIDAAFAAMPEGPAVVLVPSLDFSGTNMIVRNPADVIPTRFGSFSLVRHLDDCRTRSLRCEIVRLMRPAIDLDTPADLLEFVRTPTTTHTFSHLARLGMVHG
jgi:2-phospho-L-lactate guanylyltransferase